MPFQIDIVQPWLKIASVQSVDLDDHKEMLANDMCEVDYYNVAQFARQFDLLQLIPLPPYASQNANFIERIVVDLETLESIAGEFMEAKLMFELHPFLE